jgi:hypothetical protein
MEEYLSSQRLKVMEEDIQPERDSNRRGYKKPGTKSNERR